MPFIEVKIVEGVLPDDKKHELIAALTDAVSCVIQEIRSGWWGVAGKPLTTEAATPK